MSNTDNLIEELSFRVKDAPYDHLLTRAVQRLVTLNSENAQLKAKISDGIRVCAERQGIMYWECSEATVIKNATLLLDKGEQ